MGSECGYSNPRIDQKPTDHSHADHRNSLQKDRRWISNANFEARIPRLGETDPLKVQPMKGVVTFPMGILCLFSEARDRQCIVLSMLMLTLIIAVNVRAIEREQEDRDKNENAYKGNTWHDGWSDRDANGRIGGGHIAFA